MKVESEYCWCLHCEKVLLGVAVRKAEGCPICGAGMMDIWSWEKARNGEYPKIPVVGE